jgi:hypothetical protein
MIETADGNYFLIGYSQSYRNGDSDILLMKVSPSGALLWQKILGGYGNDYGRDIIKTSDGNYLIVGSSNSERYTDQDAYLIKIDPNGTVKWSKYIGGMSDDYGFSIKQTSDGGFVMLGQTYSYNAPGGDAYLVKLKSTGDTSWTKRYGGAHGDEGVYITNSGDGGYVFVVRDSSSAGKDVDIRVIKTDANGTVAWNKSYGGTKKDTPKMIQKTLDGGYIIGGHSRSFGWVNPDMWILKCNSGGDTLWTRHYGGYDHEHCYVVRELPGGSLIAVGKTASYGPDFDPIFIKLNSSGNIVVSIDDQLLSESKFNLYPNPATDKVNLILTGGCTQKVCVRSLSGDELYSKDLKLEDELEIDFSDKANGIYLVSLMTTAGSVTKKVVVAR